MPIDLFRALIDEIATVPDRPVVRLHAVGEPTLWSGLASGLTHAKARGVTLWLFTSGVGLNSDVQALLAQTVDIIEVSLNSTSRADYLYTKGVDRFDEVVATIRSLRSEILRHGKRTRLIASRVQSQDATSDREFCDYWPESGLLDDAFLRTYHTYNNLLPELAGESSETRRAACLVHWARMSVACDGRVVVCFNELFKPQVHEDCVLGQFPKQTLTEIWRSTRLEAIRAAELSGDYSRMSSAEHLPCPRCRACQPVGTAQITSENQVQRLRLANSG